MIFGTISSPQSSFRRRMMIGAMSFQSRWMLQMRAVRFSSF